MLTGLAHICSYQTLAQYILDSQTTKRKLITYPNCEREENTLSLSWADKATVPHYKRPSPTHGFFSSSAIDNKQDQSLGHIAAIIY
jgi:hypothetical protein